MSGLAFKTRSLAGNPATVWYLTLRFYIQNICTHTHTCVVLKILEPQNAPCPLQAHQTCCFCTPLCASLPGPRGYVDPKKPRPRIRSWDWPPPQQSPSIKPTTPAQLPPSPQEKNNNSLPLSLSLYIYIYTCMYVYIYTYICLCIQYIHIYIYIHNAPGSGSALRGGGALLGPVPLGAALQMRPGPQRSGARAMRMCLGLRRRRKGKMSHSQNSGR